MRIALVDLNSLFVPAWKAIPASEPASTVHDTVITRVRRIADDFDHVGIAIDSPPYDRTYYYPEYKANRRASPEELSDRDAMRVQLQATADTLRRDGFAVLGVRGLEADDIIATLVTQSAALEGVEIVIVSGDKDLCQLVAPGIVVQSPRFDAEGKLPPPYDVDAVTARFGVGPDRIGDYLALMGDKSDGIPGVDGIGAVHAAKLLNRYGTLGLVLQFAAGGDEELPPKMRERLTAQADVARLSRELVALRTDAPVSIETVLARREPQPQAGAEYDDEPEEWAQNDEEPEDMSEADQSAPAPEAPPIATANGTTAPAASAPAAKVYEIEPPAVQRAPADAIERLARFMPEPGSDAWAASLEPTTAEGAWHVAKKIFNARVFQFANVEQCFAAIMLGRSLGIGVMAACRNVHIVKGKLTVHVDLLVGLVKRSPLCEYWQIKETTKEHCTIKTKRRGNPEPFELTTDIDDAIDAKLVPKNGGGGGDSTWDKFRRQMIRHACEREVARAEYQDVTAGLYTPEELSDYSDLPAAPRAA